MIGLLLGVLVVSCGIERHAVKTLADPMASTLRNVPTPITVEALRAFAAPAHPEAIVDRAVPVETTLYRVRARLRSMRLEPDGDYHLVLVDLRSEETMIAEIPAPYCVTSHSSEYRAARAFVDTLAHHRASRRPWYFDYRGAAPPVVTVTGYGFYDRVGDHAAAGQAPNGIEIHPVLRIESGGP